MTGPPPRWLAALPALFAIGAKIGGSPSVGAAAMQGAEHGNQLAEEQRLRDVAVQQHQQQMDLQQQAHAQQIEQQAELHRQTAIRSSIDDLRAQKFPSKKEYDAAVGAHEQMLGQFYGVRPNMLRSAVPYNGPTVESRAKEAMDRITKEKNWAEIVTGNGAIRFDRDEDGIEENVPVLELANLAKFPIARDPQSGQPMLPPKDIKPENVQEFDVAYKGVLSEFAAEGKDVKDPKVQGVAATTARERISKASRQGSASVVVQSGSSDSDAEAIAQAIMAGDQPPDLKGLYRMGPAVRAHLAKNKYDLSAATQDWTATQRHLATLNGPQQLRMRQAIDNASHSLDTIETLADQWKAGRFPILNRGRLAAAKNGALGPEAAKIATALDAQIADVTSELANVYMGGSSPTDHAMGLASKNLSADWSEGTLRQLIQQQRQNLRIRQNSIANTGAIGGNATNQYAPSTPTQKAPPISATSGVGDVVLLPDGRTATITEKTRTGLKYRVDH